MDKAVNIDPVTENMVTYGPLWGVLLLTRIYDPNKDTMPAQPIGSEQTQYIDPTSLFLFDALKIGNIVLNDKHCQ